MAVLLTSLSTGTFPLSCPWTITTAVCMTHPLTSVMTTRQDFVANLKGFRSTYLDQRLPQKA